MEKTNVIDALGAKLKAQFDQVKADRQEVERRWLNDLRQFKGVYEPEEEQKMSKNKSRYFNRITRVKVRAATARLMDMVFPAGSDDNMSIEPTPVPDIPINPVLLRAMAMQLGRPPSPAEVRDSQELEAKVAAARMEQEIRDQLVEVNYRKIMRGVIQSGNLFGTGIVKGPLVNRSYRKAWTTDPSGKWTMTTVPKLLPFIEFTPVWEVYPETIATTFRDARYTYQRSIMPRHELLELSDRPDFKRDIIRQYMKEHPDGDTTPLFWETELRRLGWNLTGNTAKGKRFEVAEYWGVIEAQELLDLGLTTPSDDMDEYWANVWLLGSKVIKIGIQPIAGMTLPFYAYYWEKDETSIFGEGIPSVMRDDQSGLNSSSRAMMDNAAITAGPMLEANVDLLHPDEDYRDVRPFKVFARQGVGVEAQYPAIRELRLTSHTNEYLSLSSFFLNNINEATLPSYMHGEATSKGSVGRTAAGLSMLMSAAQITFKDQLFSIDDDVQKPLIQGLYFWNMQFNPKTEIKGDFNVVVKGTSSLVAREIRAQNLDAFAQSTLNPQDAPFIDRYELNKQRAIVLELGDDIIRDKEQAMHIYGRMILREGTDSLGDGQGALATDQPVQGPAAFNGANQVGAGVIPSEVDLSGGLGQGGQPGADFAPPGPDTTDFRPAAGF